MWMSQGEEDIKEGKKESIFANHHDNEAAGQASILSMACSASTQTIAVGTELENHAATIHLW